MNLDNVIKQGYLKKTTQARRLSTLFKRDAKRWFIFGVRDRHPYLEYYEKEESIFREPPINVFDLSNCRQITYTLSNRNPVYTFCIVWENHAMELSAYTRADMLDWCSKLENALRDLDIIAIAQVRGEDTEHVYVDADFLKRKKDEISTVNLEEEVAPTRPFRRNRATVHTAPPQTLERNESAAAAARDVILLPTRRSWDCTVENKNYDNMLFNDDARLPTTSNVALEEGMSKSKSFDTASTLKSMSDNAELYLNMTPPAPLPPDLRDERKDSLELRDSGMGRSENSDENNEENIEHGSGMMDSDIKVYDYESICEWTTLQSDWSSQSRGNGDDPQLQSQNVDRNSVVTAGAVRSVQNIGAPAHRFNSVPGVGSHDAASLSINSQPPSTMSLPNQTTAEESFCHSENTYVVMPGDYSESETDVINEEIQFAGKAEVGLPRASMAAASSATLMAPTTSSLAIHNTMIVANEATTPGALKPIHMSLRGRCDLLEDKEAQKNIQLLLATCRSRGSSTSSSVSGDTTGSYRQDSSSSSLATTYEESHTGATDEYVLGERGSEADGGVSDRDRVSALPVLMEQIHEDESESSAGSVMTVISQCTEGIKHDIQKRSPKRSGTPDSPMLLKPVPQPRTTSINGPKSTEVASANMFHKLDAPPLPSRSKSLEAQTKNEETVIPLAWKSDPIGHQKGDNSARRAVDEVLDPPTTLAPGLPLSHMRVSGMNEIRPPIPARRVTSRFLSSNIADTPNDPPIPDEIAPIPPKRRNDSPEKADDKAKWKGISPGIISQLEGSLYLTNAEDDEECLVSNFLNFVQTDGPAALAGSAHPELVNEVNCDEAANVSSIKQNACANEIDELEGACAMSIPQMDETPLVLSNQLVKRSLSTRQQIPTHSNAHIIVPLKQTQAEIMRQQIESVNGISVELKKADCVGVIAFVDCFQSVWVAGWNKKNKPRLHDAFHIGDQLVSVNAVIINNANEAQKAIKQSEHDAVVFMVRRTPHAKLILIHRAREGQNLGIQRVGGTAEIAYVDPNGLSAQFGLTSKASCVSDPNKSCNWALTEVNNRSLSLSFKALEIDHVLNAVGKDITLMVQPSELIHELKKQLKHLRGYKNYLL